MPPLDKTALRNATRILRTSLVSSPSAELVMSARILRAISLSFAWAARVKAVMSSCVIAARIVAGILILPPLESIDLLKAVRIFLASLGFKSPVPANFTLISLSLSASRAASSF